nr:hypothetical protein [Tanacetum cinerariifolium]
MSRDVLTIGSTMRLPLLYRGEYSQWSERFMNYLEEQTNGEEMINSIKNGDQPLPRVTQVSIAKTSSTKQPPLKDKPMWSDQEKKIQKIDRLTRSILIQGLPNEIYSLIDSNKTAKDLWDALARHMLGFEYGEQDRKDVTHNDSEDVAKLINQMTKDFDKKIMKYYNRLKKAYQQSKDFKNQTKFLQEKCDVLKNQTKIFEVKNNDLHEQIKVLNGKNDDFLAQTKVLQEQLKVKHAVIDNHVECQEKYAKLEAERYEYMIRYSAYIDNDKKHRKQIADQEILFDKMSYQLVELDENVRMLKNTVLEKDLKTYELKGCASNKNLEIKKCLERLNECENNLHKTGQTT